MAGKMADYLDVVSPDYAGTLSVCPQRVMTEQGAKNIDIHQADNGDEIRVILSDTSIYYLTMEWEVLEEADSETIMDFWADTAKANGAAYSFLFPHPTDGNTYVVRFDTDPGREIQTGTTYGITQIRLRVLGKAA